MRNSAAGGCRLTLTSAHFPHSSTSPLVARGFVQKGWAGSRERACPTLNLSRSQAAYEDAFDALFATLDDLEERLGAHRYLAGASITEADWRLFPTLVRFDAVYVGHFKCNKRRIEDYPNLSNYLRELYQYPGVADTVNMAHIKGHYYGSHVSVNPSRIVPKGPVLDFTRPHDRDRLPGATVRASAH